METLIQSEVFFFISSVGFVVLFILCAVVFFYVIKSFRTWDRILNKLEDNIGDMSDTAKDMLEDVRESTIFNFIVGRKKHTKKHK